ncbi:MAG: hypothetical protein R2883_01655 [Caldisericia bacterium]
MRKRRFVLFFLTAILIIGIQVPSGADFPIQEVSMVAKSDGVIIEPQLLDHNQFETFLTEETYSFGDTPNVWVQKLNNGDIFMYFRQEPDAPGRIMTFDFLIPGETNNGRCWKHKYISRSSDLEDDLEVKYVPTDVNTVVDFSEGITFVEFGEWQRSIFVSCPGRFKEHPVSLQRKVKKASSGKIIILPDKITLTIEFAQTDAEYEEGFIVFSDKRLIDIQNKRSLKALIATDLNLVKMLRRDGWWYTTRVGDYKGSVDNCYYFNPGFYPAENLISWYLQPSNRLFTDIVLTSMRAAVQEMPESGFHKSQVIPLMFWRWYGLTNNYIDTRFATDGSRFLIKCAEELGSPGARLLATKLGDEFIRVSDDQKTKMSDGYFLYDYITRAAWGSDAYIFESCIV